MEPIADILSRNVKQLRLQHNYTQTELANLAGVHLRYVQDIEAGRRNPTVGVIRNFRIALECGWEDLLEKKARKRRA
jgi:transcriptional regulator with XRE-family HTH domain